MPSPITTEICWAVWDLRAEVEAMRAAWKSGGFHAARKFVTDRLFEGLPLVAATSADEIVEQIKPYQQAGATRIILPYVAASDDVVNEMKHFITCWSAAATELTPTRKGD